MADKEFYRIYKEVGAVGRLTKDPYIGAKNVALSVAVNQSYKGADGTWKNAPAEFIDILAFDDDTMEFVREHCYKGTTVEFYGRESWRESEYKGELQVRKSLIVDPRADKHFLALAEPVNKRAPAKTAPKAAPPAQRPVVKEEDDSIPF